MDWMVPSKLGCWDEPMMVRCPLIKVKEKGLAVVTQRRESQLRFLPGTKSLFSGAGVDTGTDTSSVSRLWSHPLVNMPPLQVVCTLGYHPQFSLYHPEETPPGGWLPLTPKMKRRSVGMPMTFWGWAPGTAVLVSCCHRELVLEVSAPSWNWHISKVFFFFLMKYLWQEIRLDIPEASKSLWTHCPVLPGTCKCSYFFLKEDPNTSFLYI